MRPKMKNNDQRDGREGKTKNEEEKKDKTSHLFDCLSVF